MLDGVRVLELGGHISAPFCAKLLADYGADVVKVEPPGQGDEARRMGPFVGDDPHAEKSIPFLYLNTNKRGITLDPALPSGKKVLASLIGTADIVIENFSPSDAEALGLTYASLSRVNPHLVVTSITPFGLTGPYRDYTATDIVNCAFSGLMYHSGDSDREPLRNVLNQSISPIPFAQLWMQEYPLLPSSTRP
jgi:crotonobetainyl-CoA:carnitine CoA-transferase CaiB-like acyl-CoA transferase